MAFESAHGLAADGDAGPEVWAALMKAVAQRQVSTAPYDYLEMTTTSPETLSVWRDGKVIYQSLANTGIAEEPTAPGTYPVYLRYASTTMSGYNPQWQLLQRPRRALRGVLQRQRRRPRVSPCSVRLPPEPRLRRAPVCERCRRLQLRPDRHARQCRLTAENC
jgi:hypothetical protein